jgi:DNA-binding response OmpR family regulator
MLEKKGGLAESTYDLFDALRASELEHRGSWFAEKRGCRIIHRMLSDEQHKVQTSQSVADALGAIERKHFDAYVIDFKLPDGSGLDDAERIRSKWGATPIILISAMTQISSR